MYAISSYMGIFLWQFAWMYKAINVNMTIIFCVHNSFRKQKSRKKCDSMAKRIQAAVIYFLVSPWSVKRTWVQSLEFKFFFTFLTKTRSTIAFVVTRVQKCTKDQIDGYFQIIWLKWTYLWSKCSITSYMVFIGWRNAKMCMTNVFTVKPFSLGRNVWEHFELLETWYFMFHTWA